MEKDLIEEKKREGVLHLFSMSQHADMCCQGQFVFSVLLVNVSEYCVYHHTPPRGGRKLSVPSHLAPRPDVNFLCSFLRVLASHH